MPSYLVHAAGERARIRHRVFARADRKRQAMEILKNMEGIAGIKPGTNSLLIFLEPEANLKTICDKLEQEFPDLAAVDVRSRPQLAAMKNEVPKKMANSNTRRQLELKTLFASGVTTLGLAIFGLHHLHALAGGVFSLFAIQHIWQRRNRL